MNETDNNPIVPATQKNLLHLMQSGILDRHAYERALKIIGYTPDTEKWNRFLNILLLVLGAGLTVSGIYFFFAYNWADIHRFAKLGIIEALLLGLVVATASLSLDKLSGKITLTVAGFLIGALLAVFGQVYQTGADSYQLFLGWTILMTGWVFISRFTPLWFLWVVLINTSLILYWEQMRGYGGEFQLGLWILIINGLFVLAWELLAHKTDWLISRWTPRILSLAVFYIASAAAVSFVLDGWNHDVFILILASLFLPINGATLYLYSQRKLDLFMLTLSAISLMVVFDAWFADLIESANDFVTLLLGVIIIAQTALVVTLLLRVSKSWEARGQ